MSFWGTLTSKVPATTAPATPATPTFSIKTLPSFVGGGAYNFDTTTPGTDTKLINTGHTDYAGLPPKVGFQRNDIVPVGLGGSNSSPANLEYESAKDAALRDVVEKYAEDQYKKGNINLNQARVLALNWKNVDTPTQTAVNKQFGGDQNFLSNFLKSLPGAVGTVVKTDLSALKGAVVQDLQKYTPGLIQLAYGDWSGYLQGLKKTVADYGSILDDPGYTDSAGVKHLYTPQHLAMLENMVIGASTGMEDVGNNIPKTGDLNSPPTLSSDDIAHAVDVTPEGVSNVPALPSSKSFFSELPHLNDITAPLRGALLKVVDMIEPAAPVIRNQGLEPYANVIKAVHAPEAEVVTFDKNFNNIEKSFAKYTPSQQNDFNMLRGTPQSAEAQAVASEAKARLPQPLQDPALTQAIKETSDYVFNYAKANGLDLSYFDDYFYGSYKNSAKVSAFLDYWRSTENYAKQKNIPTPADAAAFGLQLKDPNPITNIKSEMVNVAYRVGMKTLKDQVLADNGLPIEDEAKTFAASAEKQLGRPVALTAEEKRIVRNGPQSKSNIPSSKAPGVADYATTVGRATPEQMALWQPIHDPVFSGMLFEPKYAKFVNSLISTNKISSNLILKGVRQAGFLAQQMKFFGSAFHVGNELKAAISSEVGGILNPRGYVDFAKSFKTLDQTDPLYKEFVSLGGGHKYSIESQAFQQVQRFLDKTHLGWLVKGTKYFPISPGFTKWMFTEFVPSLKFQKYIQDVASMSQKLGRDLTPGEKIQIIKTNQNYYGEMNERLFGRSGTATSALRLLFSAPSYAEGNFRVLGKATAGNLKAVNFVVNSLVTTLVAATIGTYIMTGKKPDTPKTPADVRDLFKIKTNMKDGNGDTVYYDAMTYDKDFWSIYGNLATGQAGSIPGALTSRVSSAVSTPARILTDLSTLFEGNMIYDFKGQPIFYKTDPFGTKVQKFIMNEGLVGSPISFSTFSSGKQKGLPNVASVGSAVVGIRPTTSEKVKTVKASQTDLYSLQDSKRNTQIDLNKLNNENPAEAMKQAKAFNAANKTKLFQILKTQGVKSITKTELDKYIITSLRLGKPKAGSTIAP